MAGRLIPAAAAVSTHHKLGAATSLPTSSERHRHQNVNVIRTSTTVDSHYFFNRYLLKLAAVDAIVVIPLTQDCMLPPHVHEHVKLPGVLRQVPPLAHGSLSHSFTSATNEQNGRKVGFGRIFPLIYTFKTANTPHITLTVLATCTFSASRACTDVDAILTAGASSSVETGISARRPALLLFFRRQDVIYNRQN